MFEYNIMVQKFKYTYNELMSMTVLNLRALVQKHNYVNAIFTPWCHQQDVAHTH